MASTPDLNSWLSDQEYLLLQHLPEGETEAGGVRHQLDLLLLVLVVLHGRGAHPHFVPHGGRSEKISEITIQDKQDGNGGKYSQIDRKSAIKL